MTMPGAGHLVQPLLRRRIARGVALHGPVDPTDNLGSEVQGALRVLSSYLEVSTRTSITTGLMGFSSNQQKSGSHRHLLLADALVTWVDAIAQSVTEDVHCQRSRARLSPKDLGGRLACVGSGELCDDRGDLLERCLLLG